MEIKQPEQVKVVEQEIMERKQNDEIPWLTLSSG
jgi:hypothetical protein